MKGGNIYCIRTRNVAAKRSFQALWPSIDPRTYEKLGVIKASKSLQVGEILPVYSDPHIDIQPVTGIVARILKDDCIVCGIEAILTAREFAGITGIECCPIQIPDGGKLGLKFIK